MPFGSWPTRSTSGRARCTRGASSRSASTRELAAVLPSLGGGGGAAARRAGGALPLPPCAARAARAARARAAVRAAARRPPLGRRGVARARRASAAAPARGAVPARARAARGRPPPACWTRCAAAACSRSRRCGDAAARELLAEVHGDDVRERLVHEAGGNPLYLEELARTVAHAGRLPGTLLAAVGREVARAAARRARQLLDGAAVVGERWDPELAARAAGLDPAAAPEAIDVLVGRGVARRARGRASSRSATRSFRRAVYDAAPAGGRLARTSGWRPRSRSAAPRRSRARITSSAARSRATAPPSLVLAEAADASAASSPLAAAHWYEAALGLLPDDDEQRGRLLAARAHALDDAGRTEEARAAFVAAIERAAPDERLELVLACAHAEHRLGARRRRAPAARARARLPAGPARAGAGGVLPLRERAARGRPRRGDGARAGGARDRGGARSGARGRGVRDARPRAAQRRAGRRGARAAHPRGERSPPGSPTPSSRGIPRGCCSSAPRR